MARRPLIVTPGESLLRAYRAGIFPMAETREAEALFWLDPEQRGVCRSTTSICRAGCAAPSDR